MDYQSCPNLVAMFFDQAKAGADKHFLWSKRDKRFRSMNWEEAADAVSRLAHALREKGIEPGDRVMLVSENRPEWPIADLAIMAIGAITVPAYVTNTTADHRHIIADSGAKAAIVSTEKLAERLLPAAHEAASMRFVVAMETVDRSQSLNVDIYRWFDLVTGAGNVGTRIADEARRWQRDDIACIIYTSGTGGAPKGVMLHHGAILHNCQGAYEFLRELGLGHEVFLSFLPLSHAYEHTAGQFFPISIGAEIYYAEGIESLSANLTEAKPTLMTAVPRLYELMQARMLRGLESQSKIKRRLFEKTVELGRKRQTDGGLSLLEKIEDGILDRLVRKKVRERFGGRLKALVSGGAPLNPEVGRFFTALGLRIVQGYGQTESAPLISVNRPLKVKMETVGPPVAGVEVRIAEDGEILARGEMVMKGYWNNPKATAEAIRDGWLHTGDIGRFDEDGYILITDRKKDIIVNSGGDNLSPQRVEGLLTLEPEISQAMVYGDRRPHLVAVLVPDAEWMRTWAKEHDLPNDLYELAEEAAFQKALGATVSRVNTSLSNIEKVRRFMIADAPFTVDNEMMTPTLKIRRHKIRAVYGEKLEKLYG